MKADAKVITLDADTEVEIEDDWAGLTDPVERRRRQNRVNQRAYRRRRQAQRVGRDVHPKTLVSSVTPPSTSSSTYTSTSSDTDSTALTPRHQNQKPYPERACFATSQALDFLERFSQTAYESYVQGNPASDHLLTLSKVNVFRAFVQNITLLGMSASPDWMHDDAISPFSTYAPGFVEATDLPISLRPTHIQRTVSHHPWIDFFPLPRMRDNLVSMGDKYDDEELCLDIMDFWDPRGADNCKLLVWGDPADPRNWEVTEAFLRKWAWVVRGCPELLDSTNHWRRERGDKMIFRNLNY